MELYLYHCLTVLGKLVKYYKSSVAFCVFWLYAKDTAITIHWLANKRTYSCRQFEASQYLVIKNFNDFRLKMPSGNMRKKKRQLGTKEPYVFNKELDSSQNKKKTASG